MSTLEELRQAEQDAYNRWMHYESAGGGYDAAGASLAQKELFRAQRRLELFNVAKDELNASVHKAVGALARALSDVDLSQLTDDGKAELRRAAVYWMRRDMGEIMQLMEAL